MASYQFFLKFLVICQLLNNYIASIASKEMIIYTPSYGNIHDRHYTYYETSDTNCLSFQIKADKDAHIALSSLPNKEKPWIEIVIGGWVNTKTMIRRCVNGIENDYEQTNVPLSADEFKGFWITWNSKGEIRLGREGNSVPFGIYDDKNPVDIKYYAVSLAWDSFGTWIIQEPSCPNLPKKPKKNSSFAELLVLLSATIYVITYFMTFYSFNSF